jgi:foldase protein PrsA
VFSSARRLALLCAVLTAIGVAGCGGASTKNKGTSSTDAAQLSGSSTESGSSPSTVVATVGSTQITKATLEHWVVLRNPEKEVPDPPTYSKCIASLGSESHAQSTTLRKSRCEQRFQELMQPALSTVIHSDWLIGEAAEEGLRANEAAVKREFDESKRHSFPTQAEFDEYLARTKQTAADVIFSLKVNQLSQKIFERLYKTEHGVSRSQISRYYNAHKKQFAIVEGRDLRIVRTTTESAASSAKRELEAGKSFSTLVKSLSAIGQPIHAKDGLVLDLVPHFYSEKELNDAIFSAPLHKIEGPVKVTVGSHIIPAEPDNGFFVFEVTRIIPKRQMPLAQVEAEIRRALTEQLKRQTLFNFVKAFRARWTARTDCRTGYVVQDCRQFKMSKTTPPTDPYAF